MDVNGKRPFGIRDSVAYAAGDLGCNMSFALKGNENWLFVKDTEDIARRDGEQVTLPHSWNAIDGQDGGNDYFRGSCLYSKTIKKADLPEADLYYLEFRGANSSADVYVGGEKLAHHDGGYSTWRVNITEKLAEETDIAVIVDNSANEVVYPQMADFTFYGGIYRDVNLICASESHFDLDYYGGPGFMITPQVSDGDAKVEVEAFVKNLKEGQKLVYTIYDKEEQELDKIETTETKVVFEMKDVHLWNGRKDPYLYCCEVEIMEGDEVIDNVCSRFGCRSFEINPNNGLILNGEEYPLRGVSRHQDRWGVGNALLPEHHEEDIDLICEVGATTIRLAHYQHDQYFYDLCDEKGLVIWAEIPYISKHMPTGRENTISQMKELVVQNYNHPSIVVWGLSNEISIAGSDDDLLENHRILNDMVHEMDKTRLTTIAAVSMCKMDDPYLQIPEVELFVNGKSIGKKTAEDHFFYFDVENVGESTIVAKAGEFTDEGVIRKVDEMNMDYVLVEKGAVLNWFDIDAPEGRFSLNDKISDIMASTRGKIWFLTLGLKLKKKMDANKKGDKNCIQKGDVKSPF